MDLDHARSTAVPQRNVQISGPTPGFHAGQAKRRARKAALKQAVERESVASLIRRRNTAVDGMLRRAEAWELLGPNPLPHGLENLQRLRAALDEVAVIDARLRGVFEAGATSSPWPPAESAAFRRRLFSDLVKGRHSVATLPISPHSDDEPEPKLGLLQSTTRLPWFGPSWATGRQHRRLTAAASPSPLPGKTPALSYLKHAAITGKENDDEQMTVRVTAIDRAMTRQAEQKDKLRRQLLGI